MAKAGSAKSGRKNRKYLEIVKVFIGSPRDLQLERQIFPKIIQEVNDLKAKSLGFILEPVGWEDTLPGRGRPQEVINRDLVECDLSVFLLWQRWGTPTGKYTSGFEEEFYLSESQGIETWLYVRSVLDDRLTDPGPQLRKVLDFRKKVEDDKKLLYRRYEDEGDWKNQLMRHLCAWLDLRSASIEEQQSPLTDENPLSNIGGHGARRLYKKYKFESGEFALTPQENKLIEQVTKHISVGEFTKAEEKYAKMASDDSSIGMKLSYADFLVRIGLFRKAEKIYNELVVLSKSIVDKTLHAISLVGLARIECRVGDVSSAKDQLSEAKIISDSIQDLGLQARVEAEMGYVYQLAGLTKEAESILREALREIPVDLKMELEPLVQQRLASVLQGLGKNAESRELLESAIENYKRLDDTLGRADAILMLGSLDFVEGRTDDAQGRFREVLSITSDGSDSDLNFAPLIAGAKSRLGDVLNSKGQQKEARILYEDALSIYQIIGYRRGMASIYASLGRLETNKGDYEAASIYHRKALALDELANYPQGVAQSLVALAHVEREQGKFEEAIANLKRASAINKKSGHFQGIAVASGILGDLLFNLELYEGAQNAYQESLEANMSANHKRGIAGSLRNLGRIHSIKGDNSEANLKFNQSLSIVDEIGYTHGKATTLRCFAEHQLRNNNLDDGLKMLNESKKIYKTLGRDIRVREIEELLKKHKKPKAP